MRILIFFAGVALLSSCVPNKKYVYLQKDDLNQKGLPKDSVVRSYDLVKFDYKIQPQDIISVRFESLTPDELDFFAMNNPRANANVQQGSALLIGEVVDHNGEIPLPVVGKVKVSGLTIFQIQDTLQALAAKYFEAPTVKIRLLNYRITLLGEVMQQGTFNLVNNRTTMLEAIGMAGGLSDLADRSNLKLIRQVGDSSFVQYIDLLDENFINSPYYYVHQNDVVIVSALRQRPFRKYFGANIALVVSSISLLLLAYNIYQN